MEQTKTYSEKQNIPVFDWNKALSQEKISDFEWTELDTRASSWVTCACGNQCAVIPRDETGEPLDADLQWLGISFMMAIRCQDADDAKEILQNIESRSAYLIKQIQDEQR